MEDPIIPCDRCHKPGGSAYMGWQLLCKSCIRMDDLNFWEDKLLESKS
jgi:hypothetical protein